MLENRKRVVIATYCSGEQETRSYAIFTYQKNSKRKISISDFKSEYTHENDSKCQTEFVDRYYTV